MTCSYLLVSNIEAQLLQKICYISRGKDEDQTHIHPVRKYVDKIFNKEYNRLMV